MEKLLAAALVVVLAIHPCSAAGAPSLQLVATIPLPGVKGRIDHLAADVKNHVLFVAALGNDSVEVIDTQRKTVRSIRGLLGPQGVLHVPGSDRMFIANGGADRVDIVDAGSLQVLKRVDGMPDADNVRYDAAAGKVVVGYGGGALRFLDPRTGESAGDIALPGHPESFELEQAGARAFVNVPSANAVVVVDRGKRSIVAEWHTPRVSANFPMALDESARRLFVGARSPAVLLVYDTETGEVVARVPVGGDADDIFFDAQRKRVYVICGEGRVDVIRPDSPDRYTVESSIKTSPRARTGLFVAEDAILYVAAPSGGSAPARLLVYRVMAP